ncbi:hypothetical protein Tco_0956950 [Tanacetum coccineum]
MVKDYELYKYNPGMENRIWNDDDKQRSQEFIKLIKRRLKIRRIFRKTKHVIYLLSHSELVGIEKVAVSSSLRVLKPKCTIESKVKRSSINLIRTLFQDAPVLRTSSAAAKPYQGDSSEFYLITGSIYTDKRGTVVFPKAAAGSQRQVRFITTCSYFTDTS